MYLGGGLTGAASDAVSLERFPMPAQGATHHSLGDGPAIADKRIRTADPKVPQSGSFALRATCADRAASTSACPWALQEVKDECLRCWEWCYGTTFHVGLTAYEAQLINFDQLFDLASIPKRVGVSSNDTMHDLTLNGNITCSVLEENQNGIPEWQNITLAQAGVLSVGV